MGGGGREGEGEKGGRERERMGGVRENARAKYMRMKTGQGKNQQRMTSS